MKTTKIELENVVEITYLPNGDKNNPSNTLLTAMVAVPEESLPPMSEEDKRCGGRLLTVYFNKAVEILKNELGPVEIYPGSDCFRFMGEVTLVCGKTIDIKEE